MEDKDTRDQSASIYHDCGSSEQSISGSDVAPNTLYSKFLIVRSDTIGNVISQAARSMRRKPARRRINASLPRKGVSMRLMSRIRCCERDLKPYRQRWCNGSRMTLCSVAVEHGRSPNALVKRHWTACQPTREEILMRCSAVSWQRSSLPAMLYCFPSMPNARLHCSCDAVGPYNNGQTHRQRSQRSFTVAVRNLAMCRATRNL